VGPRAKSTDKLYFAGIMKVGAKNYRTIWMEDSSVFMIEQNLLPFTFSIFEAKTCKDTCMAIRTMITRGAGAIGAAAGFAMAQAFIETSYLPDKNAITLARKMIESTRPTAYNLFYATKRVYEAGLLSVEKAITEAQLIAEENIEEGRKIGVFGNELIKSGFRIETHCNAGALGFVDYGTAISPIVLAHNQGKNIFVYVDETRPRNQGSRLTAWELHNGGIPFKVIPDNAGAYLMSKGLVDMMIVGADRVAANGDVANKIGTFEKAIVAKEFGVPFYVAAPLSTIDLNCNSGDEIDVEERDENEVLWQTGMDENDELCSINVAAPGSSALNPAFDVTPAQFITSIITDKGIINPDKDSIKNLTLQ